MLAREVRDRLDRGVDPEEILVLFRRVERAGGGGAGRPAGLGDPGARRADPAARRRPVGRRALAGDRAAGRGLGDRSGDPPAPQWPGPAGLARLRAAVDGGGGLGGEDIPGLPGPRAVAQLARSAGRRAEGPTRSRPNAPGSPATSSSGSSRSWPRSTSRGPSPNRSTSFSAWPPSWGSAVQRTEMRIPITEPPGSISSATRWRTRPTCWSDLGRGESRWSWAAFVRRGRVLGDGMDGSARAAGAGLGPAGHGRRGRRGAGRASSSWPTWPRGHSPHATPSRRSCRCARACSPDDATRRTFSREMLRFLRVLGSAESGVVLIYPDDRREGAGAAPRGVPRRADGAL